MMMRNLLKERFDQINLERSLDAFDGMCLPLSSKDLIPSCITDTNHLFFQPNILLSTEYSSSDQIFFFQPNFLLATTENNWYHQWQLHDTFLIHHKHHTDNDSILVTSSSSRTSFSSNNDLDMLSNVSTEVSTNTKVTLFLFLLPPSHSFAFPLHFFLSLFLSFLFFFLLPSTAWSMINSTPTYQHRSRSRSLSPIPRGGGVHDRRSPLSRSPRSRSPMSKSPEPRFRYVSRTVLLFLSHPCLYPCIFFKSIETNY